jgi:hypothetical protein
MPRCGMAEDAPRRPAGTLPAVARGPKEVFRSSSTHRLTRTRS